MKYVQDAALLNVLNAPLLLADEEGADPRQATLCATLRQLILRMPISKMSDAESGRRVLAQLASANGSLALEDSDYEWAKVAIDKAAPALIGLNAVGLRDAFAIASDETFAVTETKE